MTDGIFRIGIVGATSLLGKELSDELQESMLAASDLVLLDDEEETAGQVTSAGDEAVIIQKLSRTSFERLDFVFFTGPAESTQKHWEHARRAEASIVDLTYALEAEPGVLIRAPWVSDCLRKKAAALPGLTTAAVVSAHPAAAMLALVAARLQAAMPVSEFAATVFEPASQYGRESMDELHQQTVNLLSFKDLPREQYDAQVAFNLLPALGEAAEVSLSDTEDRIRRHYSRIQTQLLGETEAALPGLHLQLIQVPVFHGYVVSVFVRLQEPASSESVRAALAGDGIDIVSDDSDPPSNLSAAGQEDVMVRVRATSGEETPTQNFWLWLAADNLKLAAINGISCANELKRLRPKGKIQ